jgi:hypothetical protein
MAASLRALAVGGVIVVDTEEVRRCNDEILRKHRVPATWSLDLNDAPPPPSLPPPSNA